MGVTTNKRDVDIQAASTPPGPAVPSRAQLVSGLVKRALDLPPAERAAFLEAQCGSDPGLRVAVEEMLRLDGVVPSGFLREPPPDVQPEQVPRRIGRFRILRVLGEGGMGVVYEAEHERLHRHVALKVLRAGVASSQLLHRFLREQEVLAQLQHPNIAQLYEAGMGLVQYGEESAATTPGAAAPALDERSVTGSIAGLDARVGATLRRSAGRVPFFAMELVHGRPLTEFSRARQLTPRRRLELFVPICDAVQHAHQHGVIHRDLKPGNILVETDDGDGASQGIAGPVGPGIQGAERVNESSDPGGRPATADHASRPGSSAGGSGAWDRGARPKILDFGVARLIRPDGNEATLQTETGQLLGTVPYMSPEQVSGRLGEVDTRSDVYALGAILYELLTGRTPHDLRNCSLLEAARTIQEEEPSRLGSIDSRLRGDVETIVLKALEKDKTRRYPSAADLGADIRHYLADEPIIARPASTLYQLGKFARRHKALCGATAAVFLVLAAATAVSTTLYVRAERALRGTAAISQFLSDMISVVDLGGPIERQTSSADLTVREMLLHAKDRVDKVFAGQPLLEADIRATLASAFTKVGDWAEAEPQARRAWQIENQMLGPNDPKTLRYQGLLAWALHVTGRSKEALANYRLAYDGLCRVRGPRHTDTFPVAENFMGFLTESGRYREGESLARDLLTFVDQMPGPQAYARADILGCLATAQGCQGRLAEAEQTAREALDIVVRDRGPTHHDTGSAWGTLGIVLDAQGRYVECQNAFQRYLEIYRKSCGENHPYTLTGTCWLVEMEALAGLRDHQDAVDQLMAIRATGKSMAAPWSLARLLNAQGRFTEAEQLLREIDACNSDPFVVALIGQGRFEEAASVAEELVQSTERAYPDGQSLYTPVCHSRWGRCLAELGRYDEAEQQLNLAYDGVMTMRGPQHRNTQEVIANLVRLYELWDKPDEAAAWRAQLPAAPPVTTQP